MPGKTLWIQQIHAVNVYALKVWSVAIKCFASIRNVQILSLDTVVNLVMVSCFLIEFLYA